MRNFFTLVISIFLLTSFLKAQTPQVENAIPTGLLSVVNPDFAQDILVANANPIGPMSGIKAPDGNIYVAINDTLLTSNLGLIVMKSTNNGNNWSLHGSGINVRAKYGQVKLCKTADSVYCIFRIGGTIARWNPVTGVVGVLNIAPSKDFDVAVSSTNAIFVNYQTNGDTVRRVSSVDGGITWGNPGLITNLGGAPRTTFSSTGDTLILNYRGPLRPDNPEKSIWRSALYRQSSNGVLGFISLSFVDILTDTTVIINELKTIRSGLNVWTVYARDSAGNTDIKCLTSADGGKVYAPPISIASSPAKNEYWFDIGLSQGLVSGMDLIYYSDSLGGIPTPSSDKMIYQFSPLSAPTTFGPPLAFSEFPPVFSTSGSKPVIVELPLSDFGALFLGYTGGGNKIYWDRFSNVTNINHNGNTVAEKFELKQNYPNPFNPTTNISFTVVNNSFVSLKVFDIMGREVAKLVSENMNKGNYSVQFDGRNLSSGVYFYKLESGNFSEVKKMSLIK